MKHLHLILLLATCPACTVGYQGLLDEADSMNTNIAMSPDADAQTIPDTKTAAESTDAARDAACIPLTACLAVRPGCFTQQDDGCGGTVDCMLSKDCYMNIPDGAVACVVSSCPNDCAQAVSASSVPCCSTITYGACGCSLGAAGCF